MDFKKETWTIDDIHQLEKYLKANASSPQKISWTKNITRTEKPLFACPNLYKIARQICKGNYKDFLDKNTFSSWDITQIYGYVLTHEKDFFTLEKYFNKYVENIDSWSNTDLLKFNTKYYESELFELAKKYTKSTKTYAKRTGLKILFSYSNFSKYTSEIFNILNSFYNEKDVLTTSLNQQISIFTNAFSTNCGDTSFIDESNGSRILHNDVRNQLNSYNIMNKLDESKPIMANAYLKDGVYYFSGYFYKENNNNKVTFNNKFAFIASNYGYSYFSPNSTSESGYRKYIYESDLRGYKFKNVSYKSFSQKEYPVFIFTFENNHGSIKEYALRMDGIGARAKYYSRSFFEKHKSNKINFCRPEIFSS